MNVIIQLRWSQYYYYFVYYYAFFFKILEEIIHLYFTELLGRKYGKKRVI
jgi:hypothetical protein